MMSRAVIKSQGPGIFPSYYEGDPWLLLFRASDRLWRKKSNFVGVLGTNLWKNQLILWKFRRKFQGELRQKAIGKKQPILWLFSRQISVEIDRFF